MAIVPEGVPSLSENPYLRLGNEQFDKNINANNLSKQTQQPITDYRPT
jgi:hypothetical protein